MFQNLYSTGGKRVLPSDPNKKKCRLRWRKELVLLCSVAAILVGVVGGTLAFLVAGTDDVENKFTYDWVSCEITETFDGKVKSDIAVKNTSSTEAYIRAEIVVTWQNADGDVYGKVPQLGTDYAMSALGDGWAYCEKDGYYYYTLPVAAGGTTEKLFESITQTGKDPAPDYTLCVEILADAIQSSPAKAVAEAWGVTVASDGTISK